MRGEYWVSILVSLPLITGSYLFGMDPYPFWFMVQVLGMWPVSIMIFSSLWNGGLSEKEIERRARELDDNTFQE